MRGKIFLLICILIVVGSNAQKIPSFPSLAHSKQTRNQFNSQKENKKNVVADTSSQANNSKYFQIGGGIIFSSLNYLKNAQEHTFHQGLSLRASYQVNDFLRFLVDYSKVDRVNIEPTWLNVKNTFFDIDAHFLYHTPADKIFFYFILGASIQRWQGFYTGIEDYNYAFMNIKHNSEYKTIYYGGNFGFGFEYEFIKRIFAYGEVKCRMTKTDVGFGLTDVCYSAGLKYTLLDFTPKPIHSKPGKHFKWIKAKSQRNF